MHLGLYHEPVHIGPSGFDTYGPYARYVAEFARHFERVTVFAPATAEKTYFSGCAIDQPNVTVVPLPWFTTHAGAYRRFGVIKRIFRQHAGSLDVINARGTAPLAYLLWWMTRKRGVPLIYHFASDPFEVIARSPRYGGIRRILARALYAVEFAVQKHIVRQNYAFTSGQGLCNRLRRHTERVESVVTSSLIDEDYYLRADTCQGSVVRLLYVGGLREGKGLVELVEAAAILLAGGRQIELDIVGDGPLRPAITARAGQLQIQHKVHLLGKAVMGPELNSRYQGSDIFVLPSVSEGSPKVVLEAMAHSLPVVATDVGNIPEMLAGGQRGVMLSDNRPEAIAQGVARLLDEPDFRRRCIAEGYGFARQHGLDSFIARMAQKARELAERKQA